MSCQIVENLSCIAKTLWQRIGRKLLQHV